MGFTPNPTAGLTVRSSPPSLPPDLMAAGEWMVISTRAGLELRLAMTVLTGSIVVRPWVYRGGNWEPVRADGGGNGAAAVTVSGSAQGGQANGIFMCGPMACAFCLVAESGDPTNLASAILQEYFVRS